MIDFDKWCGRCKHYEFEFSKGILCGLTHQKPNFQGVCPVFEFNPTIDRTLKLEKAREVRFVEENIQFKLKFSKTSIFLIVGGIIFLLLAILNSEIATGRYYFVAIKSIIIGFLLSLWTSWNEFNAAKSLAAILIEAADKNEKDDKLTNVQDHNSSDFVDITDESQVDKFDKEKTSKHDIPTARPQLSFEEKVEYLRRDIENNKLKYGLSGGAVDPPFYKLVWAVGIKLTPPLFASYLQSFLLITSILVVMLGIVMVGFWAVQGEEFDPLAILIPGSIFVFLFPLFFAKFVRNRFEIFRELNGHLDWEDYLMVKTKNKQLWSNND